MMGVYIKGMEMPKSCTDCWFEYAYEFCESEYEDCPLIELPPHGRLIDADALLSLLDKCMFPSDMVTTSAVGMAKNWIKDAPTIVEADPPKEE